MTVVIRFQPGLRPTIQKHETHDQSTHGSWAKGSNKLNTEEIMALHKKSDAQKSKLYKAESKLFKEGRANIPAPTFDKKAKDFESYEEYDKAYKQYKKEWNAWAKNETKDIQSDLGKKFLDGTPKGVKKYVENVLETEFWKENFGDSPIGKPEVKMSNSSSTQGSWEVGRQLTPLGYKYINNLKVDRNFTMNEPTLLHELSHYATAINQTTAYEPHGSEFARNHINIVTNIVGQSAGRKLRKVYVEEGVSIAN